jgi:catalase-peroxidase
VSLADLIVLGGCAGVEAAAKNGGHDIKVPFSPGRTDTTQELTDASSRLKCSNQLLMASATSAVTKLDRSVTEKLIDRAQLLRLTAPEMTVLLGGMRVLNTNADHSQLGVFTKRPVSLTNDFFVNLLDMNTVWRKSAADENVYEGTTARPVLP